MLFEYLFEYPTGPREVSEAREATERRRPRLSSGGMPQSVRRRAEEARDVSQRQSPLFTTGRSSTKSRRRGLTSSTGPLPVREPARGLRVGVPAVAAVPDTPEVSRELEELAAALRPAEEETCDGLES